MSDVKERLKRFIEYNKMSVRAFEIKCGLTNAYVANLNVMTNEKLNRIMTAFPSLNPMWLLNGEGEMLKEEPKKEPSSNDLISALREIIDTKSSMIELLQEKLSATDERLAMYREKMEKMQQTIDELQKRTAKESDSQSSART